MSRSERLIGGQLYVTANEAARRLGISRMTVLRYLKVRVPAGSARMPGGRVMEGPWLIPEDKVGEILPDIAFDSLSPQQGAT